jgi:hypothetical protein
MKLVEADYLSSILPSQDLSTANLDGLIGVRE